MTWEHLGESSRAKKREPEQQQTAKRIFGPVERAGRNAEPERSPARSAAQSDGRAEV